MTERELFYGKFEIKDGRMLWGKFADINDRDGFEISLGMYKGNLGPVPEEVFLRFLQKFNGELSEGAPQE